MKRDRQRQKTTGTRQENDVQGLPHDSWLFPFTYPSNKSALVSYDWLGHDVGVETSRLQVVTCFVIVRPVPPIMILWHFQSGQLQI